MVAGEHNGSSSGSGGGGGDPVAAVSRWVDEHLYEVRTACGAMVAGCAVISAVVVVRAVRDARAALALATNADVAALVGGLGASALPVHLTVRVVGIRSDGCLLAVHAPWWQRWVVGGDAAGGKGRHTLGAGDSGDTGGGSKGQGGVDAANAAAAQQHLVLHAYGVDAATEGRAAEWLQRHVRPGCKARVTPVVAVWETSSGGGENRAADKRGSSHGASVMPEQPDLHCAVLVNTTERLWRRWARGDLSTDIVRLGLSRVVLPPGVDVSTAGAKNAEGGVSEPTAANTRGAGSASDGGQSRTAGDAKTTLLASPEYIDTLTARLAEAEAVAWRESRGVWADPSRQGSLRALAWLRGALRRLFGGGDSSSG